MTESSFFFVPLTVQVTLCYFVMFILQQGKLGLTWQTNVSIASVQYNFALMTP